MIAIWIITQWQAANTPDDARIIELGPGDATLLDDILRVLSKPFL